MTRWMAITALAVSASSLLAQSTAPRPKFDVFEVATVKPVDPEPKTGLSGRYDFDLEWAPDETHFGGGLPPASEGSQSPPLFEAIQQQLGLKLEATRGPVAALVVDKAERPSAN
jgi:hypothetical protein